MEIVGAGVVVLSIGAEEANPTAWTALTPSFCFLSAVQEGADLSQPGASGIVERDPDTGLISHRIETCPDGARRLRPAVEMDRS